MRIHVDKDALGGLPPVPAAVYRARVTKTTPKQSREKKTPMVLVEYTLLSAGPDPNFNAQNRKVFDNITITEETIWKVNQLFSACAGIDFPEGDYTVDELINKLTSIANGKEVMLDLGIEPYQGKDRNKVQNILAVTA